MRRYIMVRGRQQLMNKILEGPVSGQEIAESTPRQLKHWSRQMTMIQSRFPLIARWDLFCN